MPTPSSKSDKAIAKYRPYWEQAMAFWPQAIRVDVTGSVETFAARFRDARTAFLEGKNTYHEGLPSLSVAMCKGYVLIGTPGAIKAYKKGYVAAPTGTNNEIEVDISDEECAIGLCKLIKARVFKTPVAFTVGPLSNGQVKSLETNYGVTLVPVQNKTGIFTLL